MWNVNAVLMGGLGKDPIIAEAQGLSYDVLEVSDVLCCVMSYVTW